MVKMANCHLLYHRRSAKIIAQLKQLGQIVIVATHEPYFDQYADEIIHLHYGEIERVERFERSLAGSTFLSYDTDVDVPSRHLDAKEILETSPEKSQPAHKQRQQMGNKSSRFSGFKHSLKRDPKLLSFSRIFPLALVFLVVLLVATVQGNFQEEYARYFCNSYPLDFFVFNKGDIDGLPFRNQIKVYEHYTASEGDVMANYIIEQKDSVFKLAGMIKAGRFPQSKEEILVSPKFLSLYFSDKNLKNADAYISRTIVFKNQELTISGITPSVADKEFNDTLRKDVYYREDVYSKENLDKAMIFIPYETIKELGEKTDLHYGWQVGVFEGLGSDKAAQEAIKEATQSETVPSVFYGEIVDRQNAVNAVAGIFAFVLLVIFSLACIFLVSIIRTELFYRRKEIGFLQIFGLSKKRIKRLLRGEYLLKILAALVLALLVYIVAVIVYWLLTGSFIIFNLLFTPPVLALLFLIYWWAVNHSIKRFLKQSILSLTV